MLSAVSGEQRGWHATKGWRLEGRQEWHVGGNKSKNYKTATKTRRPEYQNARMGEKGVRKGISINCEATGSQGNKN